MKKIIAILLFWFGVKPKVTLFLDDTISLGYGKKDNSVGLFEYQIPFWFSEEILKQSNYIVKNGKFYREK